jgi:hypothetical protein
MRQLIFALVFAALAGCSSTAKQQNALDEDRSTSVKASHDEAAPPPEDSSSRILSTKKKCPRHSKLVNGKCTLDVESND